MPRFAALRLELGIGNPAVVVVGNESRRRFLALGGGEIDDAIDVALDQEGQEVGAVGGGRRVGRERDHRLAGRAHDFRHLTDVRCEQGADHDLGAVAQRLLGSGTRAVRRRMIVLDENGDFVGARESA